MKIQRVERVLPGGVTDALLDDSDGVPYGLDIDYGVRYEILNSTGKPAFALFEREGGGTFEYIQEFPKVVSRPLGPALPAAAAAPGSPPGALTVSPATTTPGPAPFVTLGLTASNLGSPIDVTLPARSVTTVEFSLRFPLLDPCEARPGGDVLVGCAGVEPIRQCGSGKRHVKWKHTCLRVTADHVGAELRGEPQLETIGGSPIKSDKWTMYLPGADAHHESTHTPISEREAQEVELRAVLVEMPRRASDPERVVRGRFVSGFTGLLSWKLTQVSTHSGIAANWGKLTDRRGDMSFEADSELREPLPETVRLLPMFSRKLFVKDYAGSARIHAELKILDRGSVSQRLHPKTTDRQLPTDYDRDGLPDFWEKSIAQSPTMTAGTDLDEDRFQVHAELGDGLSAWEEARGFRVKGKHYRTDEMPDDTPLVGGGTVGANNKGGPHRKDLFIDDSSDLFAGSRQQPADGAFTSAYGLSTHLIFFSECQIVPPRAALFGQINHLTPPNLRVEIPSAKPEEKLDNAQFRLRIVPDLDLDAYGHAGAFVVRDRAEVRLNLPLLASNLEALYAIGAQDWRYTHVHRMVLAHEFAHRFTLRHPVQTVSIAAGFTTTSARLQAGVDAQVFTAAENVVRQFKARDGSIEVRIQRPVKVRLMAAERVVPGGSPSIVVPLREPIDIRFPELEGNQFIQFSGGLDRHARRLPSSVVDRDPIREAGAESLTRRTAHYLLKSAPNEAQDREIAAGRAVVRFHDIPLTPPPVHGDDWMANRAGNYFFPADGVPAARRRLMRMKGSRPFKPEFEEE